MVFEPQAVDRKSWRIWFVEGLQLTARAPLAFTVLALVFAGIGYVPLIKGQVFFVLAPLLIGGGCRLAAVTDTGKLKGRRLAPNLLVTARLLVVGITPIAILGVFALLLMLGSNGPGTEPLPDLASVSMFEGGRQVLGVLTMLLWLTGVVTWTMVPLIAVAELPLAEASDQALEAFELNRFLLGFTLAAGSVCMILNMLDAVVLAIPAFAVLSAMMYVSYRHIWLDKIKNDESTVPVTTAEQVAA
ncbi:hypothetical protein ACQKCL_22130 [Stutzerimonas stutzeri]